MFMFKAIIILCYITTSYTFPDGAPIDACVKERVNQPNHGAARSQPLSTLPYTFIASSCQYEPEDLITVLIEATTVPFKGFFVQARSVETNDWIGTWENVPNTTVISECSSVTHSDSRDKTQAVLLWRAPESCGKVYFTGTILQNYGTFWCDLISEC